MIILAEIIWKFNNHDHNHHHDSNHSLKHCHANAKDNDADSLAIVDCVTRLMVDDWYSRMVPRSLPCSTFEVVAMVMNPCCDFIPDSFAYEASKYVTNSYVFT